MNDMQQASSPPETDDLPKRRIARVVSGTTLTMALAITPTFLVGGLVVLIREDLGISEAQLGLSVSVFSVMAALLAVPCGLFNDRGGGYRGMLVALSFATVSLLGLGTVAGHWVHLAVFLGVAGVAQAFAASATNLSLLNGLPNRYQGLGFGIKTSAIPVASMCAGLSLPAIGLTVGWRWAFIAAVGLVALTALLLAPEERQVAGPPRTDANRAGVAGDIRPLVAMAVAAGVSTAAGTAMMAFWVVSAVASGVPAGHAGLWFSVGSAIGIVGRIAAGRYIDRTGRRPLSATAVMLGAGAAGLLIVAVAAQTVLLALATVLVFGCGVSWTGLLHLAVVRNYRATPAAATGITQLGMRTGGIAGPAGFGLLAEYASYAAAWACAAAFLAAGAALMGSASRTMSRSMATAARTDDHSSVHNETGETMSTPDRTLPRAEAYNMSIIGHCDLNGAGDGMHVNVHGGHAYVGHMGESRVGTSVVDVSDPRFPRVVAQIETPEGTHSHKVQVHENTLVVNYERNHRETADTWQAGLKTFDISDPTTPRELGYLATPGKGVHRMTYWEPPYAFMSGSDDGYTDQFLIIADLTDPSRPKEVGRWWYPGMHTAGGEEPQWDPSRRFAAHHAIVRGDRAYCSWWDGGFVILDISDLTSPRLVSHVFLGEESRSTHTTLPVPGKDLLVVTDEAIKDSSEEIQKQVRVVDISDENRPEVISRFPVPEGDFSGRGGRFGPHNVHEPKPGTLVDSERIYLTYFNGGIRVVDISDPYKPVERGYCVPQAPEGQPAIQLNDLTVTSDGLIYVTDRYHGGLYIMTFDES